MSQSDTKNPAEQETQSALNYQFLILRVREEKLGDRRIEWRGEMLHVDSNTTHTFEDWPELVDLIANALGNLAACVDRV